MGIPLSELAFVSGFLRMLQLLCFFKLLFHSKPVCARAQGLGTEAVHCQPQGPSVIACLGARPWGSGAQLRAVLPRVSGRQEEPGLTSQGCVGDRTGRSQGPGVSWPPDPEMRSVSGDGGMLRMAGATCLGWGNCFFHTEFLSPRQKAAVGGTPECG